jgi:hypothetical protein
VKFVIPQTSTLGPLPFNIFISDTYDYIKIMSTSCLLITWKYIINSYVC